MGVIQHRVCLRARLRIIKNHVDFVSCLSSNNNLMSQFIFISFNKKPNYRIDAASFHRSESHRRIPKSDAAFADNRLNGPFLLQKQNAAHHRFAFLKMDFNARFINEIRNLTIN